MVAVATLMAFAPFVCAPARAHAEADPLAAENDFVARINQLRASKGLSVLTVHAELVEVARHWAASMAAADRISHNGNLGSQVSANWVKLGENVGVGATIDRLHTAFVNSPAHYRNLVDPAFNYIGVGVVVAQDGSLFTAHQFMRLGSVQSAVSRDAVPDHPAPEPALATTHSLPARWVIVLEQLRELDGVRAA